MTAPLSTRRSSVGIAVVNNYLYASKWRIFLIY
jgi:hypothetical protein